jgi:chemotaxis protein histidine kinase CheA
MDVVRANIERIGGLVEVESKRGRVCASPSVCR